MCTTWSGVTSSAASGRDRRGQHVQPAVVAHRVRPEQLRLAHRDLVADDVDDGLLRLEVEMRRDAPELQVEVDQDDPIRPRLGRGDGDVDGHGRGPDAALGAEHGHGALGPGDRQAVARHDRRQVLRALEAQQERLDPRFELAGVERPGDDVVRSGLEEADALLDVVAVGDAQDRAPTTSAGVSRISRQSATRVLAADLAAAQVEDRQLVLDDAGEGILVVTGRR